MSRLFFSLDTGEACEAVRIRAGYFERADGSGHLWSENREQAAFAFLAFALALRDDTDQPELVRHMAAGVAAVLGPDVPTERGPQ